MIAPHSVLRTAGIAKTQLNNAYGKIKRLGPSLVGVTTDLQALEDELHAKVWPHVGAQKNAMRSDLGVETDDE
ncbi:hypothetical protein SAMN05216260_11465 [Streptomyces griseoaurantiacus]|nr:hypothetical protein SAMN05216260_11465 [Streptomyces jietaisiensis]